MKTQEFNYRSIRLNPGFVVDIVVAVTVAAVFSFFAMTIMHIDSDAGSHMVFPPGRTVYM